MAKELGIGDVWAYAEELPARQLFEWMAYAQIEPFGEERMDLRFADFQALYANSHRGKNTTPFKPQQFMRKYDEDPRESAKKREAGERKAAALRQRLAADDLKRAERVKQKAAEKREQRKRDKEERRKSR